MPRTRNLTRFVLLPEVNFISSRKAGKAHTVIEGEKVSEFEVCPKCAAQCFSIYDRRGVNLKDAPIRGVSVKLKISKRRFYCKTCRKVILPQKNGQRDYAAVNCCCSYATGA